MRPAFERAATADTLSRFVFEGAAVRGALVSPSADRRARSSRAHPYPPALARVLAELTAAARAARVDAQVRRAASSLQLAGDGPVRLLVVECTATLACARPRNGTSRRCARCRRRDARPARRRRDAGAARDHARPAGTRVRSTRASSRSKRHRSRDDRALPRDVRAAREPARCCPRTTAASPASCCSACPASGAADDATWARVDTRTRRSRRPPIVDAANAHGWIARALFPEDDLRVFNARPRPRSRARARARASRMRCASPAATRSRPRSPSAATSRSPASSATAATRSRRTRRAPSSRNVPPASQPIERMSVQ